MVSQKLVRVKMANKAFKHRSGAKRRASTVQPLRLPLNLTLSYLHKESTKLCP